MTNPTRPSPAALAAANEVRLADDAVFTTDGSPIGYSHKAVAAIIDSALADERAATAELLAVAQRIAGWLDILKGDAPDVLFRCGDQLRAALARVDALEVK